MFTACLIPIIKLNALFQWSKNLIVKRVHFVVFWILRLCFDVLVDGTGERDYFFLDSLTSKHEKWPPSVVSGHWHTHAKKSQTWVLEHGKRVHFLFFWILRLCFDVLVDGTGERDYFFWVL